jgi:voltage-gated potassium channel Kch
MRIIDKLYTYRFPIFTISLVAILFGDMLMPVKIFESFFAPLFRILNMLAGILLLYRSGRIKWLISGILIIIVLTHVFQNSIALELKTLQYINFGLFFLFFALITWQVILQVWLSKQVDQTVILGLISGYICLGLLGFFMFLSIEVIEPGSFSGPGAILLTELAGRESLMYFSFITLMTIGYGEIVPASGLAMNATILLGLLGQFYLVIIMAIVIGKFLNQKVGQSRS